MINIFDEFKFLLTEVERIEQIVDNNNNKLERKDYRKMLEKYAKLW